MLEIQLDDRALFLERWRSLLLEILNAPDKPRLAEMRTLVKQWDGRASIDAVGYRLVRRFRLLLRDSILNAIVYGCGKTGMEISFEGLHQSEGPLWQLVTQRPIHLLSPQYGSWDEQLVAAADATLAACGDKPLTDCTWGDYNQADIRHPLSKALPWLAPLLDIHHGSLPGDSHMPRVQRKAHGASERFAVSPGDEQSGYFHMPGGQSGHFLSPHYLDAHNAWVQGERTPFLPGTTLHTLIFRPLEVKR